MLPDRYSLLDKVVAVLWQLRAMPLLFKIRRILLPVIKRTCATPWLSLRMTPIWEGVRPFSASLKIWSLTSSDVSFNHCGTDLLYGRADWEIPFPGACMRPMVN